MHQTTISNGQGNTFAALAGQLAKAGFVPGPPPQLRPQAEAVDRDVCRALHCPACRRRGLTCRPYHKGRRYRVLAVCPACYAAEEI